MKQARIFFHTGHLHIDGRWRLSGWEFYIRAKGCLKSSAELKGIRREGMADYVLSHLFSSYTMYHRPPFSLYSSAADPPFHKTRGRLKDVQVPQKFYNGVDFHLTLYALPSFALTNNPQSKVPSFFEAQRRYATAIVWVGRMDIISRDEMVAIGRENGFAVIATEKWATVIDSFPLTQPAPAGRGTSSGHGLNSFSVPHSPLTKPKSLSPPLGRC